MFSQTSLYWGSPGVPEDPFNRLSKLSEAGERLKGIAFSKDNDWVCLFGRNGYFTNNTELPVCKKLDEFAKDGDFQCVAFAPTGGWTIFFGGNGSWTEGEVPDAAYKKIVEVGGQGATLRSVAYGPRGAWVLLYDKTGVAFGNVPEALGKVLSNAARKGMVVRCVAFTGEDWFCLADKDWWTSDANLSSAKLIEQGYGENNHTKWITFLPTPPGRTGNARFPDLEAAVDAAAAEAGVTPETPGCAVCVVDGGQVIFRKGYGLANVADKTPIRPETLFEIASVTKQFTAMAICILHDRGLISFDDPARNHIPELPEGDADHPIRIDDMLRHTSGLPDYTGWAQPAGRDPRFVGNEDYARAIKDNPDLVKPLFTPGDKGSYSNTNFMLLALIVERVSKKSYGKFVHEEIFKPLGMAHSWVYERPGEPPAHPRLGRVNALGYARDNDGAWNPSWGSPPFRSETLLTTGDGAIWTSVDDMARWDAGIRARKLIRPQTWKLMLSQSTTRDGNKTMGFGLGLSFNEGGKLTRLGHNGGWGGFCTEYYHDVAGDFALVFLSNGCNANKVHDVASAYIEKRKSKSR